MAGSSGQFDVDRIENWGSMGLQPDVDARKHTSQLGRLSIQDTPDGYEPSGDEVRRLRHVGDKVPPGAWLVAVVELAERFTFYGLAGPFRK
jgi:hypothetical protein